MTKVIIVEEKMFMAAEQVAALVKKGGEELLPLAKLVNDDCFRSLLSELRQRSQAIDFVLSS
jgi:hypothetical protein